jgi:YfiH family protein
LQPEFIIPDWPVEANIKALSSTRLGGVSEVPYNGFNLAGHVEDSPACVANNRQLLRQYGHLPAEPIWLKQVHSTKIVHANTKHTTIDTTADGSVCNQENIVCVVQTADCLPLLLTTNKGNKVAAIHAGWRGLVSGIIENGIAAMTTDPDQLIVWMGPAIGPEHFEVGEDVVQAYKKRYAKYSNIFKATGDKKWHMNIYQAARNILGKSGVTQIYGGDFCTYSDEDRFFSFRREKICGRMASMVWMES